MQDEISVQVIFEFSRANLIYVTGVTGGSAVPPGDGASAGGLKLRPETIRCDLGLKIP